MNKNAKTKTTKTGKPVNSAEKPKPTEAEDNDFVMTATNWCADHDVPTRVLPEHSMRLIDSAAMIDHAITKAGGPEQVPYAVLVYRQLLHDAALAAALHGMKRAILGLYTAGR